MHVLQLETKYIILLVLARVLIENHSLIMGNHELCIQFLQLILIIFRTAIKIKVIIGVDGSTPDQTDQIQVQKTPG
jgi:hypothetical protein